MGFQPLVNTQSSGLYQVKQNAHFKVEESGILLYLCQKYTTEVGMDDSVRLLVILRISLVDGDPLHPLALVDLLPAFSADSLIQQQQLWSLNSFFGTRLRLINTPFIL